MSTCHQAHNIPWNTFLELLQKVPIEFDSNIESATTPSGTSVKLEFVPDEEQGRVARKVKFFASKMEAAIKEFSMTERKKYSDEDIDSLSPLFEKECYNRWLKEGLSELSAWGSFIEGSSPKSAFSDTEYLEAIKELFILEKAAALLHLARKNVKLEILQHVTYSNFFHYGFGRIKEDCLTLYIHLNLLLATGSLQDPNQWYEQWKRFLDHEILSTYDGNSHARMYFQYFKDNPKFEDLDGLQKLLKNLFRMLYIYDMVMVERGLQPSWEQEVLTCVRSYFGWFSLS